MRLSGPRSFAKQLLPLSARDGLRAVLTYAQRLGRWTVILRQLRGAAPRDQLKLLASALCAPVLSLRDLAHWQDPQLLFDARVEVLGVGKFALRKHTDDLWHVLPQRERHVLDAIAKTLGPGDIFVDAGANVGFFSVLASRAVGEDGRVIAIEMMPGTAAALRRNVALNDLSNVTVAECALSSRMGDTVEARVSPGKHGQASIIRKDITGSVRKVLVITSTFDWLLRGLDPKLIKMDLEGAEKEAAEGATKVFAKTRSIVFEDWGEGDGLETLAGRLIAMGFRLRKLDGRNWMAYR
jgi:FkbM family methyltransferase